MQPTYTFHEIKALIRNLDDDAIIVLGDLIEDEKERFSAFELRALHRFIKLASKEVVQNAVKAEYLLSYN